MRTNAAAVACWMLLVSAACAEQATRAAVDLVLDGRAAAAIVVPDDPLPVVKAAAEELRYHVERASGARLSVIREAEATGKGPRVLLGACRAARELGIPPKTITPNGFVIRCVGDRLFLAGDDSPGEPFWVQHGNRTRVGTLFAVYEFLQRQLGVRWLWPGRLGEVVPACRTVRVTDGNEVGKPAFVHARWRDGSPGIAGTAGWATPESRSLYLQEQGIWLRRHRFALGVNMDITHAFTGYWKRFGAAKPDLFNLLPDGTRRSDPTYYGGDESLISMCVSQPAFWQQIVADWKAARTAGSPWLDVSENDTPGKCTCPKCLSWDRPAPGAPAAADARLAAARTAFQTGDRQWAEKLGSLSDRYARFYLEVQRLAQPVDPEAVVMGFAYANYTEPPRHVRLNDRVTIGIVPALMFPWTETKRQAFRRQWDGWRAAGCTLMLRPNYMLDGHDLPVIFARQLGEDFSYAAGRGMVATDFDSLTGQWAVQGPNLYVLARLHTRPTMPVREVLDEYYRAFGKAEAQVRAYFAHWEAVSAAVTEETFAAAVRQETPESASFALFHRIAPYLFTPAVMARGREILTAAHAAADGDPAGRQRVGFLEKGLRNAELTLAAQRAYAGYRKTGRVTPFRTAVEELDAFRKQVEPDGIANMGSLRWMEDMTWPRNLLTRPAPLSPPGPRERNRIPDGDFEKGAGQWQQHVACGTCLLTLDSTQAYTGRQSARIVCAALGPVEDELRGDTRAWARWYRAVPVEPGKAYRLRVRVRSSNDFGGTADVWAALGGKTGTLAVQCLNTEDQWRELSIERIVPETSPLMIYLNLRGATGTLWFDDVELTEQPARSVSEAGGK
jgi:hypothetical protein